MSKFLLTAVTLSILSLTPAGAQNSIYVPDNQPAVGTCNAIPLGTGSFLAGYTYVGRVPASFLDPANTRLETLSFASCTAATWSAPIAQVAVGHVPTPIPLPFTYPIGGLGSFLDLTLLYDSASQGPLTWNAAANVWTPFVTVPGGSAFCWNGVNDIGIFLTFQSATGGMSCHRTSTEPLRLYAAGYNAPASTASGAAGLKMKLDFTGCGPALYETNDAASSLDINGVAGSAYSAAITTVGFGGPVSLNLASTNVGVPFELAYNLAPLVPLFGGGLGTAGGQILNIDIVTPVSFLNGFTFSIPFPGNFPIAFAAPGVPLVLSAQLLNFDPVHPDGFALSQGGQLNVQ